MRARLALIENRATFFDVFTRSSDDIGLSRQKETIELMFMDGNAKYSVLKIAEQTCFSKAGILI